MKTGLFIGFLAVLSIAPVYADGARGHSHGYSRAWGFEGAWIVPALMDGSVAYDMTQPQTAYVLQPAPVYAPGYRPSVAAPPAQQYWYFCSAADAYYPYVSSCQSGWQAVSMNSRAGLDKGMAAYGEMDFVAALKELRPLAKIGNAMAQFILGTMYANGQGVLQDYKEAVRWYRLAADQGRADAQNNLGVMYENGQGVLQDDKEAVRRYRLAADQGYAYAQFNMGDMYANGQGVLQDYKEAVRWYRLAADQGDADAQFTLGTMYENGRGVLQDYKEAVKWYRLAADQEDADAQNNLGEMYANGKGVHQSRVIAYALYNLSASNAPTADDKAAANREKLSSSMTAAEIASGKSLLREISKPGMLLKALDKYINKSAV
jgi:TPR repeat protein